MGSHRTAHLCLVAFGILFLLSEVHSSGARMFESHQGKTDRFIASFAMERCLCPEVFLSGSQLLVQLVREVSVQLPQSF